MELIVFIQVFNIIIIAIGTLLYMCCRPSSAADSDVADSTAVADDDDDADIPPRREKYDVFISFRGEDTRLTFTSHLHDALLQKKIETYMDNRLQRGKEVGPALLEAIEKSTISVIVFSQNYASSTWCLDELVHILKCKERFGQMVIPIFYHTNALDVRKLHRSYGDAFAQHQKRFKGSIDKVHKWREALTTAANLSGFRHSENAGTDADLIKEVVKDIWTKLCRKSSYDLKGFVGIESRIEQIESLLGIHSPDACITVGIWGMDGIGKTTLAEAVFHRHSSKFEASCFVKNVRENSEQADGLDRLEKTLLKEILKEEILATGSTSVQERVSRTKVLIVLDDVSDSMQMERLAGDRLRYGTGSRIIITSRDRRTLRQTVENDKIYKVQGLKSDDALQLFCSRAFKNNSTRRTDYKELAEKAVDNARNVPLALIVLGSLFFNCKSKQDWENEFNKLKRFPSESIQRVLRLSYDGLERHEKEIFLDIACFHKGRHVDMVKRILDVRGFFARAGIRFLIDVSLISTDSKQGRETIEMHDLLEEMGRAIVQEQCIEDPSKRNRLFTAEDVYRVLKNNRETPIVQAIRFNWSKIEERPLKHANFKKMSNLIMLIVDYFQIIDCKLTASLDLPDSLCYLEWPIYPLKSLPSNFSPENLVELHMPYSKVEKLWKEDQILVNLQVIDLACSNLTEVPNLSGSPKIVHINLHGCYKLVEIPGYFQHLDKLIHLDLGRCENLKYLPKMPENIRYLDLRGSGIRELPESVWSNENISYLDVSHCKYLEKLPSNRCELKVSGCFNLDHCTSLGEFSELPRDTSKLSLVGCERLVSLPTNICKLKYLEELDLSLCSELENFPEILEPMEHLKSLNLSGTSVKELHSSIEFLPALKRIQLQDCKRLSSIPKSICKLKYLEELNLSGCSELENFPEIMEPMEHLKSLNLNGTAIEELHSSIAAAAADADDTKTYDADDMAAASSSSAAAPSDADDTKTYDVFISFRGEDTRHTFTSHLHAALLGRKITTYIDDKLQRGDEIKPLGKAIEESELSVIIFSKNYASSTWCLDELVHILECKEKYGQLVIPIFYNTLPSDVRKQRGSYAVAFDLLEQHFKNSIDKVRKWRDALTNAANISGFDSKNYGTDADLVKKVVEDISTKLCHESISRGYFDQVVENSTTRLQKAFKYPEEHLYLPKRIEGPNGQNLQLEFKSNLARTIFTGGKVEGKQGAAIHVVLVDKNTGRVVTSGPESSVKLDIVVLEGDFNNEDDEGWTQEEFDTHVVKGRERKRPLLSGDLQVTLKEGVGTLGDLTFTDNSSWMRSRKYRLGLKVASGFCEGMRIREAKTEAFIVKDHRGEWYKKHYPPALNDEVWRLETIAKDGAFHKRLNKAGIFTVEEFLQLVVRDSQKLRNILGCVSNKVWEALLEHAKTCVLSGKLYVYYTEDTRNVGVVFNNVCELSGLIAEEQFHSADALSDSQKVYVDALVKKAYDNWDQVIQYDGKSLLNFKQSKRPAAPETEFQMGPINYSEASDQLQLHRTSNLVHSEQPPLDPALPIGGFCLREAGMAGGLFAGAAAGASFTLLYDVVKDVKDKTMMFKELLGDLNSTLEALKPLIDDIAKYKAVLGQSNKEVEKIEKQMKKGKELVLECSEPSKWKLFKKYKYTKRLLNLDKCLKRLLTILDLEGTRNRFENLVVSREIVGVANENLVVSRETLGVSSETLAAEKEILAAVQKGFHDLCSVPEPPLVTVGLDEPLRYLKEILLKGDFSMLVLTATGGCGKTTLAMKFCQDKDVKGKFKENIFFVTVSEHPNSDVEKLYQHIKSQEAGEDLLLVLDDVWSDTVLQKFVELKLRNYKILVTSRSEFPGFGTPYKLKPLGDKDSMTLLHHSAALGDSLSVPEGLLSEILKHCKGVPLAIRVTGNALSGQAAKSWLSRLEDWRGGSILDYETELLLCLQSSIEDLEPIIRECFMDLVSFPEDQGISAAAFIDMWAELYMLDGDFWSIKILHELDRKGLANLVTRKENMVILDNYYSEHYVCQHDMLRELGIYIARLDPIEDRKRLIVKSGLNQPKWLREQKSQPINARLLSISSDGTYPTQWQSVHLPQVEVLVLNFKTQNNGLPEFVQKIDKLKVLIVTNYGLSPTELSNFDLLESLSNLKRIRLESISIHSITKNWAPLKSLKKISLCMCNMGQAFHNCSIKISDAWPGLEEMNIDYCDDLVELPAELCDLVHMKVLSITNCHKLSSLPEEIGKLKNLDVLRLKSCTGLVRLPVSIENLTKLRCLDVYNCFGITELPEGIGKMRGLRWINMGQCSRLEELPPSVLDLDEQLGCDL